MWKINWRNKRKTWTDKVEWPLVDAAHMQLFQVGLQSVLKKHSFFLSPAEDWLDLVKDRSFDL